MTPPQGAMPADAEARRRAQRGKNLALVLALAGFVVLVYVVSIVRMGGG